MQNWQIFAAIIPIAKLYGLDARKINQAIGMGCECSVIPTNFAAATMSDFSHYEYGYRGRDGFLIAKAVEKGIYNQRDALDDPAAIQGLYAVMRAPTATMKQKSMPMNRTAVG